MTKKQARKLISTAFLLTIIYQATAIYVKSQELDLAQKQADYRKEVIERQVEQIDWLKDHRYVQYTEMIQAYEEKELYGK